MKHFLTLFLFLLTICHGLVIERTSIISQTKQIGNKVCTHHLINDIRQSEVCYVGIDKCGCLVFLIFLVTLECVFEAGIGFLSKRCPNDMIYIIPYLI